MKQLPVQQAIGQVLCHDITQIIPGVAKGARFRKGHIIQKADVPVLLSLGKAHIYVWERGGEMLHEDEAADLLRDLCQGPGMTATPPREGKIELIADIDGLLLVDTGRLRALNSLGGMMVATRASGVPVKRGDILCGTRVIPLVIEQTQMTRAAETVGSAPLLKLLPFQKKGYGLIITGSEVCHGRVEDAFSPVIRQKLAEYGGHMIAHAVLDDDPSSVASVIEDMLAQGADLVFCTGGMSVDPDDRTPLAIRSSGARVVSYGAPVLPGSMLMVAYTADGRAICGLPGCVMYSKRTIFDLVLPYLVADVPITAHYLAGLGHGGLCLGCNACHFPNCAFGKGT